MFDYGILNIKKKKSKGNIYFGLEKTTKKMLGVDDVQRGLACNCCCPFCETDFMARQGESRAHHFAHINNRDCLYDEELGVYYALHRVLKEKTEINIPEIHLSSALSEFKFRNNSIISNKGVLSITDVFFECNERQYPPVLAVAHENEYVQIILDFDDYYNYQDMYELKELAKRNKTSTIVYRLPSADKLRSMDTLADTILEQSECFWLYNSMADSKLEEFRRNVVEPLTVDDIYGAQEAVECPLSKRHICDLSFAFVHTDCLTCEYNQGINPVRCLAQSGIKEYTDIYISDETRKNNVKRISEENKAKYKLTSSVVCHSCGSLFDDILDSKTGELINLSKFYDSALDGFTIPADADNLVCKDCGEMLSGTYYAITEHSDKEIICPHCKQRISQVSRGKTSSAQELSLYEAQLDEEGIYYCSCKHPVSKNAMLADNLHKLFKELILNLSDTDKIVNIVRFVHKESIDDDIIECVLHRFDTEKQGILQECIDRYT